MKTVEIDEASLREYGRQRRKETWVLTRRGKPVAAVVPLRDAMDAETFGLSHNPAFIEIINRSWAATRRRVASRVRRRGAGSASRGRRARASGALVDQDDDVPPFHGRVGLDSVR